VGSNIFKTSYFLNLPKCNEQTNNKNIQDFVETNYAMQGGMGGVNVGPAAGRPTCPGLHHTSLC
jgi:hypothetical protein